MCWNTPGGGGGVDEGFCGKEEEKGWWRMILRAADWV